MSSSRRAAARIGLVAAPLLLGLGLFLHNVSLAPTKAQVNPPANQVDPSPLASYANQIFHFVQNGKVDDLAHLAIPQGPQTGKLKDWTAEYLAQIQLQEKQRDKQYADAVSKSNEELKANHFEKAMERVVLAFRIAKEPDAFLKLDWVKDFTDKVATRAADLEKKGQWLESLTLYSALNTLYETETRFKADQQRLNRRTRLLAVYAPKALLDMRKSLIEKESDPTTKPATQPDEAIEMAGFTRWQDYSQGVNLDMMQRAIQNAQENWVEVTNYDKLINGGINTLRLFLTTPELAKEFPGLADKKASAAFDKALTDASNAVTGKENLDSGTVRDIVTSLIAASDASVKLPRTSSSSNSPTAPWTSSTRSPRSSGPTKCPNLKRI